MDSNCPERGGHAIDLPGSGSNGEGMSKWGDLSKRYSKGIYLKVMIRLIQPSEWNTEL